MAFWGPPFSFLFCCFLIGKIRPTTGGLCLPRSRFLKHMFEPTVHFAAFIWTPNLHVFDLWISNFFQAHPLQNIQNPTFQKKKNLEITHHKFGWFPWLACFSQKRTTDDRTPTFHTPTLHEVISTFPSRCCPTAIACAWLTKDAHHHLKTGPLMTSLIFL